MADNNDKATYTPSGLTQFFAPKNCENIAAAGNLYDLIDLTNGASYKTMELTGYSADEIAAYKAQQDAAADEGRKDLMDRVAKDCRTAATINGIGDVLSVAGMITSVGGVASKAVSASGKDLISVSLGKIAEQGGVRGAAAKVGSYVFKAGEAQAGLAGDAFKAAGKHFVKGTIGEAALDNAGNIVRTASGTVVRNHLGTFGRALNLTGAAALGGAGIAIELAPAVVPHIASRMYTEGTAAKLNQEIVDATNTQQAIFDYITQRNEELPAELQEDYDKWAEAYQLGQADLLEAFNKGEITQEEYNQRYEEFIKASQDNLDGMSDAHKELGKYIIGEGAANAGAEYMIAHGTSPTQIENVNSYIKDLDQQYPEAAARAQSAYETRQKLDTGSTLTNFLANMNAVILHYLPGAAYVEAAVVKGVDAVLGYAANKLPLVSGIFNYQEKHSGESISDLASQISESAETRYEMNQELKAAQKSAADGKDTSAQATAADAAIEAQAGLA